MKTRLAVLVRSQRQRQKFTQKALAAKLGLSVWTLRFVEKDKQTGRRRRLGQSTAEKLAGWLRLIVDDVQNYNQLYHCYRPKPLMIGRHMRAAAAPFGQLVREHRLAQELSQAELGEKLDLTRAAISALEIGNEVKYSRIDKKKLRRLAKALQMDWRVLALHQPAKKPRPLNQPERRDRVGRWLTMVRLGLNLKQREMANRVGVCLMTWSKYERSQRYPSLRRLKKIIALARLLARSAP